jgi:predicted enzyme related to lactoylglutathione lyase
MDANSNSLNWFEICVTDIARAKKFYQAIFNVTLEDWNLPGLLMAVFPSVPGNGKATGALVQSESHKPSMDGAVIYLNADPDLSLVLSRIEPNGGTILMPKTLITEEIGYMAFFSDTEGNRMALHSQH